MKYMSLQEIAAACGGTYYGGSEFLPVSYTHLRAHET